MKKSSDFKYSRTIETMEMSPIEKGMAAEKPHPAWSVFERLMLA